MTTLRYVIVRCRLALPGIPVEPLRHRRRGKRAAMQTSRQHDLNVFESANPSIAHQLAREAKARVAPLLAASLQDPLRFANGCDKAASLINREGQRLLAIDVLARLH